MEITQEQIAYQAGQIVIIDRIGLSIPFEAIRWLCRRVDSNPSCLAILRAGRHQIGREACSIGQFGSPGRKIAKQLGFQIKRSGARKNGVEHTYFAKEAVHHM